MTIPMLFRGWPAVALALSLCGCAGDPDLPRSYHQPGPFASREARRPVPDQAAPSQYAQAPIAEARDAAAQLPAPPTYAPPADPVARGYTPPPYRPELVPGAAPVQPAARGAPPVLAGGPRATPVRYVPPPYRPELVPGYAPPQPASPPPVETPAYSPSPQRVAALPPAPYAAPPRSRYGAWSDSDYRYRIGPGDELALRFLLNPDLNGPVIVGPDGRGVFPLVSSVKVANLTADEANAALTAAYGAILRKPQVEVLITAYGSSQIYVGGEVREPGVHPLKGQLTTAQAIMTAGGLLPTARTGRVVVLRQRPDGQLLMKEVDLKAYLTKGRGETDFAVLPGDLVFVPRSKIAEVDLFVDQYINGVLPFSRSVGYSINKGTRY